MNHIIGSFQEWSEMPNYSIIIDTRDRLIPQLAYVVEENIELSEGRVQFLYSQLGCMSKKDYSEIG